MIRKIKSKLFSILRPDRNPEISRIKNDGLSYLSLPALLEIKKSIKETEQKQIPGILIETGCALGGSSILIGLTKNPNRPLFVYDVFGMIPPPSNNDGNDVIERYETIKSGKSTGLNNNKYYGYENDLKTKVIQNFNNYGLDLKKTSINLVEGLYEDTLHIDQKVAFAHIDCDWYESVKLCLQRIVPHLSVGGKLIIDDYNDWSGCKKATDEFFNGKSGQFKLYIAADKLHVEKLN